MLTRPEYGEKGNENSDIDQRIIIFWKKALSSNSSVIRTLAILNRYNIGLILSKYRIPSLNINVSDIKQCTL